MLISKKKITTIQEIEIYSNNVTYNLSDMYYKAIDKEKGYYKLHEMECKDALPIIKNAIKDLEAKPDEYKKLNPKNGWGTYEGLLRGLKDLEFIAAENPDAIIEVQ